MVRDLRRFPGFERMERLSLFLVHVYRRHEAGLDHVFYPEEDLKKRAVDELPSQGHMTNTNSRWVAIMCGSLRYPVNIVIFLYCSLWWNEWSIIFCFKNMAYDTSKFIEWCRRYAYTTIIQLIGRFNATKNVHCYIECLREATLLSKGEETVFSKVYNYLSKTKQNEWSVQKTTIRKSK